ncbi:hypothetical protein DPMN_163165 [Dreissena polymorpha]|uniref:Vwde helical domain-containing protein n=1 Tax=Dreissena polymorpha TaxID=45954 RepID=A0A9D4ERL1_DREPO|nr:hypothetical protein DPMN_163165 [Dreissena polymorpha]
MLTFDGLAYENQNFGTFDVYIHTDYYQKVTLPSGTYVDIHIYGALMNVFVYPSVADFKKTSGLSGLFDGATTNDRLNRPGSNHPDPNISWIVNAADNLFDEDVLLQPWADQYRFLKRRDANGRYQPTDKGDFHKTVQLAFVSNYRNTFIERKKREIKVYTEETAWRDWMQLLNTIAFQKCSNVSGLDFTATIKHCILDALITGTMKWTMLHLETIKSLCLQQVIIQKIPPKVDLFGITVKCRIEPQENDSINELLPEGNYQVAGVRQTYMEVSCPFEQSEERTVNDEADIDDIVDKISFSNDGVNFSEEDTLIVYDSACDICRRVEGFIECRTENDYCVTNEKCYALGDIFGSYIFGETGEEPAAWQPGFEDFTKSPVEEDLTEYPVEGLRHVYALFVSLMVMKLKIYFVHVFLEIKLLTAVYIVWFAEEIIFET